MRARKIKGWIPKAAKFCRSFLIEAMAPNLWLWIFAVLPGVLCQIKKMEPLTLWRPCWKSKMWGKDLHILTLRPKQKTLGLVDLDSACIHLWRFHWLALSYYSLAVLFWKSVPNTNPCLEIEPAIRIFFAPLFCERQKSSSCVNQVLIHPGISCHSGESYTGRFTCTCVILRLLLRIRILEEGRKSWLIFLNFNSLKGDFLQDLDGFS